VGWRDTEDRREDRRGEEASGECIGMWAICRCRVDAVVGERWPDVDTGVGKGDSPMAGHHSGAPEGIGTSRCEWLRKEDAGRDTAVLVPAANSCESTTMHSGK
jgi:hypothetical protein